ncbi:MAG: hypothetical protein RIR10_1144 [Planctomycetota bacterium]
MLARRMEKQSMGQFEARPNAAIRDARNLPESRRFATETEKAALRGETSNVPWPRLSEQGTAPSARMAANAHPELSATGPVPECGEVVSLEVGPEAGADVAVDRAERARIVGELYRANYHRVYCFARKSVGEDEAEEIAHEAFCRLLRVRNLERMLISTAYLLRIAENLIRRKYERSQRYRVILERSGMVVSDSSEDRCASRMPGGTAEAWGVGVGDEADRLEAVLRQLTDEEQTAVRLIVCEGLDYQAAARSLGVPVSTINNWKYRGLTKLRRLIEPSTEPAYAAQFPRRTAVAG